ncbi:g11222 [Coccomyxa viridis]|uniref:peptide-methionine (S)-S-oxide reductase n=1 Tax=Coccomyxa viridis TaxID=1274662 RepID=A0ABP1GD69_9CHLO
MSQLCNTHQRSGFLPSGGAHPLQRPITRGLPKRTSVLLQARQSRVGCGVVCRAQMNTAERLKPIKKAAAAAVLALLAVSCQGRAIALEADSVQPSTDASSSGAPTPIYFGNGCFWGRQKDYIDAEKSMGRIKSDLSAVVGYAGGRQKGPQGQVCYYSGPQDALYEKLGHAEVVQVQLDGSKTKQEMEKFADVYFSQFRKTPFGMLRLDPQDAGPGYRNVIGIPGGVSSPLFRVLQERNVHEMKLVEGEGNTYDSHGKALEGDKFNTVFIVDSIKLPFYQAEKYHQFHDGIGVPFPASYHNLKADLEKNGKIQATGCPENSFFF